MNRLLRPAPLAIVLALVLSRGPSAARAEFLAADADSAAETQAGAAPRLRRAPTPLETVELRTALERARADLEACVRQGSPSRRRTLRARVRLDPSHRMSISIGLRPREAAIEACADTAIRRVVQPLQTRFIPRVVVASIVVGNTPPPAPPPPSLPPHPPAHDSEAQVHAALSAMHASLIECVPDVSPGTPGHMSLRVALHVDGSMTLVGVNLPSGVRGPGSLGCLSGRVAWLRVAPSSQERVIVHEIPLGTRP